VDTVVELWLWRWCFGCGSGKAIRGTLVLTVMVAAGLCRDEATSSFWWQK
jgi:hypothetical protein